MTQEEAVARARAVVEEEGWLYVEDAQGPIVAVLKRDEESRRKVWSATTSVFVIGSNFHILIDDETGEVVSKSHTPR